MSQQVVESTKTFQAGAAIAQYLRVYLSSGKLAVAGASNVAIGVIQEASFADLDYRAVLLRNAEGTKRMVASEAVTAGDAVYAAASGKVATTGTIYEGIALEDASGNGSIFEVLQLGDPSASTASTGTTASSYEVDSDASTPKIALSGQSGGTGDFTTTLKPETTLSADNSIIVPEANGDTLVAVALAQTLTNKTLTSPVVTQPGSTFPTYIPHGAHTTSVAAAGAIPITNFYSTLDSNAGATTATLADGAVKGQLKKIQMIVDNGDVVVTPANLSGGTTITFADAGDFALLVFDGTNWVAIELGNDADGATAPVLA